MSGDLAEHLDLCAALTAGNIDPADRKRLARHLAEGCDECEQALPRFERATILLAAALPLSAPGPGLRARVLEAAAGPAPAPTPKPASAPAPKPASAAVVALPAAPGWQPRVASLPQLGAPPPWTWAAVSGGCVLAAIFACVIAWHYASEAGHLHAEISSTNQVIVALNQQLQGAQSTTELFTAPETRTATLQSTSRSETVLRARAVYDPQTGQAAFVFNDLRPAEGKVYELWAIEGPRLTSLGVIQSDEIGHAVVRVDHAGDANRLTDFGVSLENAGGSTNPSGPTGPMVMMGRVEG